MVIKAVDILEEELEIRVAALETAKSSVEPTVTSFKTELQNFPEENISNTDDVTSAISEAESVKLLPPQNELLLNSLQGDCLSIVARGLDSLNIHEEINNWLTYASSPFINLGENVLVNTYSSITNMIDSFNFENMVSGIDGLVNCIDASNSQSLIDKLDNYIDRVNTVLTILNLTSSGELVANYFFSQIDGVLDNLVENINYLSQSIENITQGLVDDLGAILPSCPSIPYIEIPEINIPRIPNLSFIITMAGAIGSPGLPGFPKLPKIPYTFKCDIFQDWPEGKKGTLKKALGITNTKI